MIGPTLALFAASLLIVPGPRDPEVFSTGRELGLLFFVTLSLMLTISIAQEIVVDVADVALLAFLVLGWISATQALVPALSMRPMALATAIVGFWFALRANHTPLQRSVIEKSVVTIALVVAAVSLSEAMGWIDRMSSPGRSPGGLFGNRNRMAHFLALSLPALSYALATARTRSMRVSSSAAVILVSGVLILARSRTAWLGAAASVVVLLTATIALWRSIRPSAAAGRRILVLGGGIVAGTVLAIALPTQLRWSSESPYVESLLNIVNVTSGSGRVRLQQQANTLRMVATSPWLGVGPGNWQVSYPRFAPAGDPSFDRRLLVPTNRLPSGDWVGVAAETGLPAVLALGAFFAILFRGQWSAAREATRHLGNASSAASPLVAMATLAAFVVMGLSEPIFLTPASAALGISLFAAWARPSRQLLRCRLHQGNRMVMLACTVLVFGRPLIFEVRQCFGDYRRRTAENVEDFIVAARLNPADYVSRALVSQLYVVRGRCDLAVPFAVQAYRLNPFSAIPLSVFSRCRPGASDVRIEAEQRAVAPDN